MIISMSQLGGAYTRALESENLFAPQWPVMGAVLTNDWCINLDTLIEYYC